MRAKLFLLIFLMLNVAVAQPVEEPKQGDSIQKLIDTMDANTRALEKNSNAVSDLKSYVKGQFQFFLGIIIVGNALMMWIIYLIMIFLEKLRRLRKKKGFQEYILELEERLKATERGLIETLKYTNDLHRDSTGRLRQLISDMDRLLEVLEPKGVKPNTELYISLIVVGFIFGFGVCYLVGVF